MSIQNSNEPLGELIIPIMIIKCTVMYVRKNQNIYLCIAEAEDSSLRIVRSLLSNVSLQILWSVVECCVVNHDCARGH